MPPQVSRLVLIFAVIIIAFVATRWWLRPDTFGEYGHYRGKALPAAVAKSPHYISKTTCAECHDDEAAQNTAGPHKKINCQTCHGPGASHIEDPSTDNIRKPEVIPTCLRCHEERAARPAKFPQINYKEHADGEACNTCHHVHNPLETE
ncbi:MAG: hypothetical protein KDB65_09765 [Calditrichaeota bacterium]|nr:hypothetical protein [Calditrichota bacterium]MCB9369477.1 hypothetical protein [Calditrichota bacterium]